jgi:hypothetical protein
MQGITFYITRGSFACGELLNPNPNPNPNSHEHFIANKPVCVGYPPCLRRGIGTLNLALRQDCSVSLDNLLISVIGYDDLGGDL